MSDCVMVFALFKHKPLCEIKLATGSPKRNIISIVSEICNTQFRTFYWNINNDTAVLAKVVK